MDLIAFQIDKQYLWSILAIALVGYLAVYFRRSYIVNIILQGMKAGIKGFVTFLLEYLIIFQVIAISFSDFYETQRQIIIVSFIIISVLMSWVTHVYLPEKAQEPVKMVCRWIAFVAFMLWITRVHFQIYSMERVLEIITSVKETILSLAFRIANLAQLFAVNLYAKLARPEVAIWLGVASVLLALTKSRYSACKTFTMIFEWFVCTTVVWWLLHREPIHQMDGAIVFFLVYSWFAVLVADFIWTNSNDEFKRWFKVFSWVMMITIAVIAVLHIIWDINFIAAVRVIFRRYILEGLLLVQRTGIWKYGSTVVKGIIEKGWLGTILAIVRKFSIRGLVKVCVILLSWQIFSIKPIRRFVKKHSGELGELATAKVQQGKDKWREVRFWTKFFVFVVIMYLLWISPWHILWPMLPKGTMAKLSGITAKLSWLMRAIMKIIVFFLKKLFGNKSIDFIMMFLVRKIAKRITKLSPDMKKQVKIILVWKFGRMLINHNRKRAEQFVFLSKEIRDANRKARQFAIDKQKGLYTGVSDLATASVNLARKNAMATLTATQRRSLATWTYIRRMLVRALMDESENLANSTI